MTGDLGFRLVLLVPLALVGIGLAAVGTTTGATAPLTDPGPAAAFTVSDSNVTVEQGNEETIVFEEVESADRIEISRRNGGTFEVTTEREQPLTERERERAKTIAGTNATVVRALGTPDAYDVSVEPIRKLTTESVETSPISESNDSGVYDVSVDVEGDRNVTLENVDGRVTIDRNPSYVEDEAAVRYSTTASGEIRYTAVVDLTNETVVDVTDWTEE